MPPRRKRVLVDVVELGHRGGTATAANRTPEERKTAARRAAQARWKAYRKAKRQEAAA